MKLPLPLPLTYTHTSHTLKTFFAFLLSIDPHKSAIFFDIDLACLVVTQILQKIEISSSGEKSKTNSKIFQISKKNMDGIKVKFERIVAQAKKKCDKIGMCSNDFLPTLSTFRKRSSRFT